MTENEKKKARRKKKPAPRFAPVESDELRERTFELDGVSVELDPLTKRSLDKTAKRLDDGDER
jgi:hypothetical protein